MKKTWFSAPRCRGPVSAGLAGLLLVACGGDGTGPGSGTGPDLTPISTAMSNAVGATIDNNAVLASLLGLRGAILITVRPPPMAGSVGRPFQVNAAPWLSPSTVLLASSVPPDLLGRTMIWDTNLDKYVQKPNDDFTAPADGVRFRLYTLRDPNKPKEPLEDIGFFDLVDASTTTLDVSGTISNNTAARAAFQATGQVGSALDFGAIGFFSDDTQTIDFSIASQLSPDGRTLTTTVDATLGGVSYSSISMAGGGGNGSGNKEVTVSLPSHTVQFFLGFSSTGSISSNSTVEVDGTPAATVSGSLSSPSVKRISGGDLPGSSVDALRTMLKEGFAMEVASGSLLEFAFFLNQGI